MPSYTQYMRQMAVLDAKDDDIESWITVKGNHIPIKKGQSKEDAVKSFIESKGGSGEKKPEKSKALKEAERSAKWWAKEDPKGMVGIYAREMKETVKELRKIEGKDPNSPEYQTALARAKRQVKAWRDEAKMNKGLGMTGIMARERKDIYNELKKAGSSEKKAEPKAKHPPLQKGQLRLHRDIDDRYAIIDPDGAYTFYRDGVKGAQNRSLKGQEGAVKELGEIGYKAFNDITTTEKSEKKDKAYNDKGLYQDALNELDDQIADKEKELENIQLSITENAESGYFDIANETLQDAEFVKGQLNELKKKREKLAGSSKEEKKIEKTPAQQHTTTRNIMTLFSKHYEDLYDGKTKYNRELVKEFDSKMANDPEFKKQVQAFVRERGDVLSSDREVQAYMMAYNHTKSKSEPIMEKLESYHNGNKG